MPCRHRIILTKLDEAISVKDDFEPYDEHNEPHAGLVMQAPTIFSETPSFDAALSIATVDHAIRRGVKKVHLILPHMGLSKLLIPFASPKSPLAVAENEGNVLFLEYIPSGLVSSYIRDDLMSGRDDLGRPCFFIGARSGRHVSEQSNGSRFLAIRQHHGYLNAHYVPMYFEGGNFITTTDYIMTLSDSVRENARLLNETFPQTDHDLEYALSWIEDTMNQKQRRKLVVLDGSECEEQTVFHLDLCIGAVRTDDGREKMLISDMNLAKELFEARGYKTRDDVPDLRDWLDDNLWEDMSIREMRKRIIHYLNFAATTGLYNPKELRRQMETVYFLPHRTVEYIGSVLKYYFDPANLQSVQSYLARIKASLINSGFDEKDIISIPALLRAQRYKPSLPKRSRQLVIGPATTPLPIYAPVNGVGYNLSGFEYSEFITGGGLKILDDEVARVFEREGIRYEIIPEMLSYGFCSAGMRCLAIPIPYTGN